MNTLKTALRWGILGYIGWQVIKPFFRSHPEAPAALPVERPWIFDLKPRDGLPEPSIN